MYSLRKSLFSLVSAALLLFLVAGAKAANTWHVPGDFTSIQTAIDSPSVVAGDTILIGPGTYHENLLWNKDLILQGAGADNTVIDVSGQGGTCLQTNGLSPASRLEGVTLTGGRTLSYYDGYWSIIVALGSGMRNIDSSPTVVHCAFLANDAMNYNNIDGDDAAYGNGAGMFNSNSSPAVIGCTFQGNVADRGAAIYNESAQPTFTECRFQDNRASHGGNGIWNITSSPTFTGCAFQGDGILNRRGGATITGCTFHHSEWVYNDFCPAPGVTITDCVFDGCTSAVYNYYSPAAITNSRFINTYSSVAGASQIQSQNSDLTLTGCLIANNTYIVPGDRLSQSIGVAVLATGSLRMTNCTVVNNTCGLAAAGLYCSANATITNCIFWNNRATTNWYSLDDQNILIYPSHPAVVTNCDIQYSSVYPGASNIHSDPLFVDATNGDFHLLTGSPCLNTGSNTAITSPPFPLDPTGTFPIDLDSNPRISGSAVDIGAFEKFIDSTPPVISAPTSVSATATSVNGAAVSFTVTATDNVDGSVPVVCSPTSGSQFPLGTTMVHCTAHDAAGNTSTADFPVTVTYSWSGFLQPINSDGSSVFKAGSTVPVKFQLTGASAGITDAVAKLSYTKVGDTSGAVNEAVSNGAGDNGNQFRYDATNKQYIFNWSTKGLTKGTYQLNIDLGDGVTRTVNIGLK